MTLVLAGAERNIKNAAAGINKADEYGKQS
ncbi:hypothetical protein IMSAGC002_02397 [Lachnospiraceae bacterium]|jgi:hypothetical protein|nr:hypothetical protein IMSAGC002_02397 [Lachnospiraceae bacterium]